MWPVLKGLDVAGFYVFFPALAQNHSKVVAIDKKCGILNKR